MLTRFSGFIPFSFILALAVTAHANTATEDMIAAESKITAATVYSDRAKVTRIAEIELPAGAHTIVFKNMPVSIFTDSLRAEGSSKATVKFGAVSHKEIMSVGLSSEREQELKNQIEVLNDQLASINAEKIALSEQNKFIGKIGDTAALRNNENIAEMNLKPEQWATAAESIFSGMFGNLKNILQQDIKTRALTREIAKLSGELSQVGTGSRSSYSVMIPVESDAATTLTVELSYQVPKATWKPTYDARLETSGKGDLKLVQYGTVTQGTGEDWAGVALTLSTAQPQRGASLPNLQPMWVSVHEGYNTPSLGYAAMDAAGMQVSSNMVASAPMEEWRQRAEAKQIKMDDKEAEFVTAEIKTGGFISEYKIPGPSTVLSDSTETKLMVGTFATESKMEVHIKPQLSTDAFLVSIAKLKGDAPILPGRVNLFRDGAYVGQDNLPLLRPDEEQQLYFGVDDNVAVKRKVLKDERSEEGLVAKDSVLNRRFVTEIQNLHTEETTIVVKETRPASKNENLRVEITKDTTQGYEKDAANITGMLQWKFPMAAKDKKNLELGWTLTWPAGMQLSGI